MTFRLLHLADLHLDRSFGGAGCEGPLARRRRQGLRDALRSAGEAAAGYGCAAVTIAGDLYEHERAGLDTERFLVETFASWQPMRVFLAPGNHDPHLAGSIHRRAPWPSNVHVFPPAELVAEPLADGLWVWGLGHGEPAWRGDPLDGAECPSDGVHLALFHGSEVGSLPEGKAAHGPFRAARIREAGFALALCGHYHARRIDSSLALCYPGTPEPLSFDDTGRRGPVLVDVGSEGSVTMTPLDLNAWSAVAVACDVDGARSTADLVDAARAACFAATADLDPEKAMVRIDINGTVDEAVVADAALLDDAVRETTGVALVRVRDLTAPLVEPAQRDDHTTRAAFIRAVQAAIDEAETPAAAALAEDALRYGLAALAGAEVGLR